MLENCWQRTWESSQASHGQWLIWVASPPLKAKPSFNSEWLFYPNSTELWLLNASWISRVFQHISVLLRRCNKEARNTEWLTSSRCYNWNFFCATGSGRGIHWGLVERGRRGGREPGCLSLPCLSGLQRPCFCFSQQFVEKHTGKLWLTPVILQSSVWSSVFLPTAAVLKIMVMLKKILIFF